MQKFILTLIIVVLVSTSGLGRTNENPTAVSLSDTVVMAELPTSFTLDATGSTDSDGSIVNYYWVMDQDTVATEQVAVVEISGKINTIKLIVVDDNGDTDTETFTLIVGHPTNNGLNRIPFRNGTVPLFASGMNIAWNRFANDLASYDESAQRYFTKIMDSVSSNGGNALRWWLHTNGANTPEVDATGHVVGIDHKSIQNMKHILDLAFDRGIAISMCLWSFDMLQNSQGQDVTAMKNLLESAENVQSYVDNALIPILELLGDHPAVLTWEIFNEAEGMTNPYGWSSGGRVTMFEVQRFANMCAGAIHRNVPGALVSTGSWSFKASTDVGGNKNYYSDEELIAAGNDPDGFMDFYQVHYYPKHFGNDLSPFHKPADYWGLDKPIVIGEFPADTIGGKAKPHYSLESAYEVAVKYGYAGAMSWSWTDYNGDFSGTTAKGLKKVREIIPDDIVIPNDQIELNRIPRLVSNIKPYRSLLADISDAPNHEDLSSSFEDEAGSVLTFSIIDNSNASLVTPVITDGILSYSFPEPAEGVANITLKAEDETGWYTKTNAIVMIGSEDERNLAYYKPVRASSALAEQYDVYVNDGDGSSYWQSVAGGEQWIEIDFQEVTDFNFIALDWNSNFARSYEIQVSDDQQNWTTILTDNSGSGKQKAIALETTQSTHYLRIVMTGNNDANGYMLDELEVENVQNNTAPSVVESIENYEVNATKAKSINNYVRFENVFTDAEHPTYLQYEIENTNPDLLLASFSAGKVGVSLLFNSNMVGDAVITITATDPFGAAISTSFEVTVIDDILSVKDTIGQINVYPNPTEGVVTIVNLDPSAPILKYQVFDLEGKEILSSEVSSDSFEVNLLHIPQGIYLLKLIYSKGTEQMKLFKD